MPQETTSASADDFRPSCSLEMLRKRAALIDAVREFLRERGYLEVETPLLSRDILVDAHLEPLAVPLSRGEMFLQTSPEFAMKRLLAAGAEAIFQITRAFRRGESGRLHNPEFTMLEWYRAGDTHQEQMRFTEDLVKAVFQRADRLLGRERPLFDRSLPFERLSYDEAFEKYAGTRVLHLSAEELDRLARSRDIAVPAGLAADDRDGRLNLLLAELVEPHLGIDRPLFLYDYPDSQVALARIRHDQPPVAERFELYIGGIEVCNGYHELTDPAEFAERTRTQAALREREGHRALPQENRLLAAMQSGLPPCAGVALGIDRLVMLALGAESLAEVMPFPFDRA